MYAHLVHYTLRERRSSSYIEIIWSRSRSQKQKNSLVIKDLVYEAKAKAKTFFLNAKAKDI